MEEDKLLEINNLTVEFITEEGIQTAVNDVSFSLGRGKTLGIVGESGSGKSVTCLSIMRLIQRPPGRIPSGEIIFQYDSNTNIDLLKTSKRKIRDFRGNLISMIFQEPMTSLNPVHKCGAQIVESINMHYKVSKKAAKQRALKLLEEVEIKEPEKIFDSYPHQISGGQKQRVMIAMAMSCNPKLLIADEPTTALDVTVQKSILNLMKRLQEKHGTSIIFITHDLGVIAEIADEVAVMYNGEIVEKGTVKEIFTSAKHPYTKGLIACRPPLDKRLKHLPTVEDFLNMDKSDEKEVQELIRANIVSSEERSKSLETIYQKEPILRVKNLSKDYVISRNFKGKITKSKHAVKNISFDLFPGETLGLVGGSGCGKTTLGRTLLNLIPATEGEVIFKGKDLLKLDRKGQRAIRKEIQIIFQDPYSSLNPRMTIGDAIMEPMVVHHIGKDKKERKEKAIELLQKVGLHAKHFERYPHEFSGGQRQRICIARTLAVEPEFIICDESVSALDVSVQAQVLNLLNDLKKEFGFTYIFISHDLSVVKFMSDRIIVMDQGEMIELGEADELYENPQSKITKELIESVPKAYL
ncbi:MAG: ABC transporter ATP-binding protein [Crocinitomicaceae bacterium]|nr:ABC transporter ATP-binding protein [Crocinitomicaceae bacterium]